MADEAVRATGPIFDGRAAEAARDYARHIAEKLADKAKDAALARMGSSFRHNEGKYMSSIHVETEGQHAYVRDRYDFVYGPWLEGVGSRNDTTRFKGYHSMRAATSEIDAQAESIAEDELKPYLDRMN